MKRIIFVVILVLNLLPTHFQDGQWSSYGILMADENGMGEGFDDCSVMSFLEEDEDWGLANVYRNFGYIPYGAGWCVYISCAAVTGETACFHYKSLNSSENCFGLNGVLLSPSTASGILGSQMSVSEIPAGESDCTMITRVYNGDKIIYIIVEHACVAYGIRKAGNGEIQLIYLDPTARMSYFYMDKSVLNSAWYKAYAN